MEPKPVDDLGAFLLVLRRALLQIVKYIEGRYPEAIRDGWR